ncbi:MAG TPA: methionine adenosyltransferase [Polyangiaceae bacterium]
MGSYLFTSESVTEGHPDKLCDAVSDAVLDAALKGDRLSRVACETATKTGFVLLLGEITSKTTIDFAKVARQTIKEIGYTDSSMGFDYETCGVMIAVEQQSPDISQGVTKGQGMFKDQGAGDQGLMFGYACDETPELMPAPIMYAHQLTRQLAAVRKSKQVDFLRPDGKSQVTVEYEDGKPTRIETVVISTQHSESAKHDEIREAVMELVVKKTLPKHLLDKRTNYYINPTGRFVIGGPCGDAGLTGRKIIVDTYGGMGRHGGGAFSGKDPTKVDRSACYYSRYVAKNIVQAGLAKRCEVQVAYAIGVAKPCGVYVNTFGTGAIDEEKLQAYVAEKFDFRPAALIKELDLLKPGYQRTAAYGHFGRSEFSWEQTSRAKQLAADLLPRSAKATNGAAKAKASSNGVKTNGASKKPVSKKAPAKKPSRKAPSASL